MAPFYRGWDPFLRLSSDDEAAVKHLYEDITKPAEQKETKRRKFLYFPFGWIRSWLVISLTFPGDKFYFKNAQLKRCQGRDTCFMEWRMKDFLKEFYFTLYDSKWHNIMQVKNKVENVLKRKPGIFSDRLGKCRDEVKNVKLLNLNWEHLLSSYKDSWFSFFKNQYGLVRVKCDNNMCMIQLIREKVKCKSTSNQGLKQSLKMSNLKR